MIVIVIVVVVLKVMGMLQILRNQSQQNIGKEVDPRQGNTNDDNSKLRRHLKRNARLISADKIRSDALTNAVLTKITNKFGSKIGS